MDYGLRGTNKGKLLRNSAKCFVLCFVDSIQHFAMFRRGNF